VSGHEGERLSAYLDGELGPTERSAVQAHLGTCTLCRSRLAELAALDEAARAHPLPAPPAGYFDSLPGRVRAALEAEGAVARRSRGRRGGGWPGRWPAWTWAAAAALLLAVVTPLTLRERSAGPLNAPPATPEEKARPQAPPSGTAAAPAPPTREKEKKFQGELRPAPAPAPAPALPSREARPREPASREEAAANDEPRRAAGAQPPPALPMAAAPPPSAPAPAEATSGESPSAPQSVAAERQTLAAGGAAAMAEGRVTAARVERPLARDAMSKLEDEGSAYRRLTREEPTDAAGWRRLREAWRALARQYPEGPDADEARVRTIEAGMTAWRMGGDEEDLDRARADLAAYLDRADARQAERARRAVEASARP
jgi:hypothetical protein